MARWPQFTIASLLGATFWCVILVLLAMRFPQRTVWEWWLTGPVVGLVMGCLVACFARRQALTVLVGLATGIVLQGFTAGVTLWLLQFVP